MKKKENVKPKKKDNMWIIVVVSMMLFIAGVLYLDNTRSRVIEPPPQSPPGTVTEASTPPPPTLYPITSSEEIDKVLLSGDPVVFYFYSPTCQVCAKAQPFIHSLEMRLEKANLKFIKVSSQDNPDIFDAMSVSEYSTVLVYKEKEIYRQTISIEDNPEKLFTTIKDKLGINSG